MESNIPQTTTPPPVPGSTPRKSVPGWARVLILIIPYLLIIGIFEYIGHRVAGFSLAEVGKTLGTPTQMLIVQCFNFVGTALVLFLMMRLVDREPFANLGFQTKGRRIDTGMGILAGLVVIGLGFLILRLTGNLQVSGIVFDWQGFVVLLLLFILVAFAEEMLVRGYILRNLMLSMNKYVALAVTSLMFSLMHIANPDFSWLSFFGIFVAGIALGATYIYTKNLWFPIAYHFSWNFFQSLFGFNVSGIDAYSAIQTAPEGAENISGGSFGFEGSVLSLAFQVIVIAVIFFSFEKKRPASSSERAA